MRVNRDHDNPVRLFRNYGRNLLNSLPVARPFLLKFQIQPLLPKIPLRGLATAFAYRSDNFCFGSSVNIYYGDYYNMPPP